MANADEFIVVVADQRSVYKLSVASTISGKRLEEIIQKVLLATPAGIQAGIEAIKRAGLYEAPLKYARFEGEAIRLLIRRWSGILISKLVPRKNYAANWILILIDETPVDCCATVCRAT
jgi:hypothetical protein